MLTRGTNGSNPASGTPTTARDRSPRRRLVRKQRRAMPVGPDPEQDQVEPGRPGLAEQSLIILRADRRPEFALHAMDGRQSRIPEPREHRLVGHGVVGQLVLRRHAPLVAEPHRARGHVDPHRIDRVHEFPVRRARRRAARQHDVTATRRHPYEHGRARPAGIVHDLYLKRHARRILWQRPAPARRWGRAARLGGPLPRECRPRRGTPPAQASCARRARRSPR